MTHAEIAKVCHEANRAYCQSIGDVAQLPWNEAEEWQRQSAMSGVAYAATHPGEGPEHQHAAWCADKLAAGWVYGAEKNTEAKTHPCLVPYDQLPDAQRKKDALFLAIVRALC